MPRDNSRHYGSLDCRAHYDMALSEQEQCNALITKIARFKHELDGELKALPPYAVAMEDAILLAQDHLLNAIDEVAACRRRVDSAVNEYELATHSTTEREDA